MWPLFPKKSVSPKKWAAEQNDNTLTSLYSQLDNLVAFRFHVKQKKLAHQNNLMSSSSGNHHALRKGRGMTFSEVRQYQAGDDIRHIDWRVTARTQKPHTKVFIEEHERPVIVVTEQTPALFFGSQTRLKINQALNISAILSWVALSQNERVGGLSFNHHHHQWVAPKRSQATLLTNLQKAIQLQLAIQNPGASNPMYWQNTLKKLNQVVKPGSKVFLVGDLLQLSQTSRGYLQKLRRHNDIVALHIVDPLEKTLPNLGWLSLTATPHHSAEQNLTLDSFNPETRAWYAQRYQTQWQHAFKQFTQLNIPLLEITSDQHPVEQLSRYRVIV
ncbi:hypothetical protein PA3071 [hydrothermal vent metagenome]|uniref:DUF58 domain-containing protein n=2 Tax=hydrothermal vent metagenome TaxID=652676 RepID=A0A3B0VUV3_9ZZZZ